MESKLFQEDIVEAYVKKHNSNCEMDKCEFCSSKSGLNKLVFSWRRYGKGSLKLTVVDLMLLCAGQLGVSVEHSFTDFKGHHSVCDFCFSSFRSKKLLSDLLYFICFFSFIASLALFIFSFLATTIFSSINIFDKDGYWYLGGSSIALLVIFFLIFKVKSFGCPEKFSSFSKPNFVFNGLKKYE